MDHGPIHTTLGGGAGSVSSDCLLIVYRCYCYLCYCYRGCYPTSRAYHNKIVL